MEALLNGDQLCIASVCECFFLGTWFCSAIVCRLFQCPFVFTLDIKREVILDQTHSPLALRWFFTQWGPTRKRMVLMWLRWVRERSGWVRRTPKKRFHCANPWVLYSLATKPRWIRCGVWKQIWRVCCMITAPKNVWTQIRLQGSCTHACFAT